MFLETYPHIAQYRPKPPPSGFQIPLVGLHGPATCGKDTVGRILRDEFGLERVAFADSIRDGLKGIFRFNDLDFEGASKEAIIEWIGKSPRQLMQTLGTEWGRGLVREDIWLLLAERKIDKLREERYIPVVITDVRFENEAELIRSKGGTIWHIYRKDAVQVQSHTSESGVKFRADLGDIRVDNNGTLQDLRAEVIDLY